MAKKPAHTKPGPLTGPLKKMFSAAAPFREAVLTHVAAHEGPAAVRSLRSFFKELNITVGKPMWDKLKPHCESGDQETLEAIMDSCLAQARANGGKKVSLASFDFKR